MGNNASGLCGAAKAGDIKKVQKFVDAGADKEAKGAYGWTALMLAAFRGHLDVVGYLVDAGADKETKDAGGWTALILAALWGHLDVVRYLVDASADKEAKDGGGKTALMFAALGGQLDVVRYLVDAGADKETKDAGGWTALMLAAFRGQLDVVRYLVDAGADKEAKDADGQTALILAALWGHLDVVRYLVDASADKEAKDGGGKTALMFAALGGQLDVVRYLVDAGADKEAKRAYGWTALIWAARKGQLDVVRYLCERGADASRCDNEGNSALIHLLLLDDVKEEILLPVAKLLLECGASPLRSNKQGKSAKSIAKTKGYHHISALVKEYAAKPQRRTLMQDEPEEEDPHWLILPGTVSRSRVALAVGGFGRMYRAKWSHSDVVVKEITVESEAEMKRFRREVELWSRLTHPNVVQLYGANHREEPYFIVSKFATNGELVKYLEHQKEQGRTLVWRKLREVAAGLFYLHEKEIVHGDLKGNNIVVSSDGTAMLIDFGLSFLESGPCSVLKIKDTLGAMAWRAPEFANMTVKTPTRKSDVYSLGMCIIEAVTCKSPWSGYPDDDEIRRCLKRGEIKVEKPAEMTGTQWEFVSRMITRECAGRPEMPEILRGLEEFAADEEMNEDLGS